jgi:hypothetical protein
MEIAGAVLMGLVPVVLVVLFVWSWIENYRMRKATSKALDEALRYSTQRGQEAIMGIVDAAVEYREKQLKKRHAIELAALRDELRAETADADEATRENLALKDELVRIRMRSARQVVEHHVPLAVKDGLAGLLPGEVSFTPDDEARHELDVMRAVVILIAQRLGVDVKENGVPRFEEIDAAITALHGAVAAGQPAVDGVDIR